MVSSTVQRKLHDPTLPFRPGQYAEGGIQKNSTETGGLPGSVLLDGSIRVTVGSVLKFPEAFSCRRKVFHH
jgi:hypothetical protein